MKCGRVGCIDIAVSKGLCSKHKQSREPQTKRVRRPHQKLYSTSWWKKARVRVLSRQPLCVHCMKHDVITPAIDVDHIKDHKGDRALFFNENNLQPLCKRCHAAKTNNTGWQPSQDK